MTTQPDLIRALMSVGYADAIVAERGRLYLVDHEGRRAPLSVDEAQVELCMELQGNELVQTMRLFALREGRTGRRGLWLFVPTGDPSDAQALADRLVERCARARADAGPRYLVVVESIVDAPHLLRFAGQLAIGSRATLDALVLCPLEALPPTAVEEAIGWQRARLSDVITQVGVDATAHVASGEQRRELPRYIDLLSSEMLIVEHDHGSSALRSALRHVRTPTLYVPLHWRGTSRVAREIPRDPR
jgi:hypothetical protein